MPQQLPNLYGESNEILQEPLLSAFIATVRAKQATLYPDVPKQFHPIAPGNETTILAIIIQSLGEATAKVNPSNQATNGGTN